MTFYNFLSSILSFVFPFIIYLFIFSVIRLIYLDVKKMSRFEDDGKGDEFYASLKPAKSKIKLENPLKNRYPIYEEAIIGRQRGCSVQIKEDFISAKHAHIWFEDGEWYLEDLGSRNGTAVNGHRIREVVILDPQDVISVGGLNFVFEL